MTELAIYINSSKKPANFFYYRTSNDSVLGKHQSDLNQSKTIHLSVSVVGDYFGLICINTF